MSRRDGIPLWDAGRGFADLGFALCSAGTVSPCGTRAGALPTWNAASRAGHIAHSESLPLPMPPPPLFFEIELGIVTATPCPGDTGTGMVLELAA